MFVVQSLKLCLSLCDLVDCNSPGFPVLHYFPNLLKLMSIVSVMPSDHLILYCPFVLLPSIFPSMRLFANESVLCIRWPKYRSFNFSINGLPWKPTEIIVIFEIASKYCISDSFADYDGYSISSKGFLLTVVDIMILCVKFTHSSLF